MSKINRGNQCVDNELIELHDSPHSRTARINESMQPPCSALYTYSASYDVMHSTMNRHVIAHVVIKVYVQSPLIHPLLLPSFSKESLIVPVISTFLYFHSAIQ